jgi:hypothetical protein
VLDFFRLSEKMAEKHQETLANNQKCMMTELNGAEVDDAKNTVKVETLQQALEIIFADHDP